MSRKSRRSLAAAAIRARQVVRLSAAILRSRSSYDGWANSPLSAIPLSPMPTDSREKTSLHGFLIIDKPAGWTSHDVVARVRRLCGERHVGHAGTLDPAATGVLPIAIGHA